MNDSFWRGILITVFSLWAMASSSAKAETAPDGTWSYRSFISDPNLSTQPNALLFGSGTMVLTSPAPGHLEGTLGGTGWQLKLTGEIRGNDPVTVRFQGKGTIGGEQWVYDYLGYVVPKWANGVDQRPAIVGSIVRTEAHSNGTAKAGVVAQWIAVKKNAADPAPVSKTRNAIEGDLTELELHWAAAVAVNDPEKIAKFLSDDFVFVGAGGVLQNQQQHLDDFKSGKLKIDSVIIKEFNILAYEDFAVVNTRSAVTGKFAGRDIGGDYRFMDTLRLARGQWLAVAREQTHIPPPADPTIPRALDSAINSNVKPKPKPNPELAPTPPSMLRDEKRVQEKLNQKERTNLIREFRETLLLADRGDVLPEPQRLSLAQAAVDPFKNPPVRDAAGGTVTLDVKYTSNKKIGNDDVTLRSYNGELVGPTLKVKAGQTLRVTLINHLPAEPAGGHITNGHHDWNTTNLHTHGLHVKPEANPGGTAQLESDNVLLELKPGLTQEYAFEIPANHPAGTFWYHAHKHGSTSAHVASGMAGALIVTRDDTLHNLDSIPAVAEAMKTVDGREREKIMLFQQVPYLKPAQGGAGTIELTSTSPNVMFAPGAWDRSDRFTTVNGQRIPVIDFVPGEIQRWRMIDSGFRETLTLQIIKDPDDTGTGPDHIDFQQLALDGLAGGKLEALSTVEMFPGYRADVLVQAPSVSGTYHLIDAKRTEHTLQGETESLKFIAKIIIANAPAIQMALPTDAQILAHRPASLPNPAVGTPIQKAFYGVTTGFVIGKIDPGPTGSVAGTPFNPSVARMLQLGLVQKWTIGARNGGTTTPAGPAHPFHIHVNPFEIISEKDERGVEQLQPGERIWRDTISMPPGWTIEFLTQYNDYVGSFVQHCHILDHEDRGMMEKITIGTGPVPAPFASTEVSPSMRNVINTAIPKVENEPSVLVFVQGSFCPHCMSQLNDLAAALAERKAHVVVVSASSEKDLEAFPKVPFTLVADPDLRLFKEYGAFDGKPKHATIVRDRMGKEVFRKVSEEPFTDISVVMRALGLSTLHAVIQINNTLDTKDDYLTWAPVHCRISLEGGAALDPDIAVTLTNDSPLALPEGGDVRFAETVAPGTTATLETLTLNLKQNGAPSDFFVAGFKAGKLNAASLANGGRDAVIEVHLGGPSGTLIGSAAAMVRVRKNFMALNDLEKSEFLKAVAAMHAPASESYEPLIRLHKLAAMGRVKGKDQAHQSSGFLPWHRAFLLLFERELQKTHPHVALPYWLMDQPPVHFTLDSLGNNLNPQTGASQRDVFFSSSDPLFGWFIQLDNLRQLVRRRGDHVQLSVNAHYPSLQTLINGAGGNYDQFRARLESNPHNQGHGITGEWMGACVSSPADPVFWIFHCQHDHLWAQWQWQFNRFDTTGRFPDHYSPGDAYSSSAPQTDRFNFPLGHHLFDTMWPWDETHDRVVATDEFTTRPSVQLGKFPKSIIDNIWPAADASPKVADMLDYLGIDPNRLSMGFAYDDVPFGASTSAPGPFPSPDVEVVRNATELMLDSGATERNRLTALQHLSGSASDAGREAASVVLRDAGTSSAVKARALSLLVQKSPREAALHALDIASNANSDHVLSTAAVNELLFLHHMGGLAPDSSAAIHGVLKTIAGDERRPNVRSLALEGLASMGDPAISETLGSLLRAPEKSALSHAQLIELARYYPEHAGLLRPLLSSPKEDVVIAVLQSLRNDAESIHARSALIGPKSSSPQIRQAAIISVMGDDPAALETFLSIAADSTELEATRATAAAGIRVLVQRFNKDLGAAQIDATVKALSSFRVSSVSELGKTIGLTLEVLRGIKR